MMLPVHERKWLIQRFIDQKIRELTISPAVQGSVDAISSQSINTNPSNKKEKEVKYETYSRGSKQ
jgi:hypothetical protein